MFFNTLLNSRSFKKLLSIL